MENFLKVCVYILAVVWGVPYSRYFILMNGPKPMFAAVTLLLLYITLVSINTPWVRGAALIATIIVGTYFYDLGDVYVCYPR